MTWAPTLTVRVELETEAGPAVGYAADLLVPKWFEKDPAKSLRQDVEGLMESAVAAAKVARHKKAESVFEFWWRLYRARVHGQPVAASDRLMRGFGVALVERAVIDAACRAAGVSFFEALKQDLFAVQPGAVYPELADWSLAQSLPKKPRKKVALRHTIGLVDELQRGPDQQGRPRDPSKPMGLKWRVVDAKSELAPTTRENDGLPESLEEDIAAYGLRWFKLKWSGDPAVDLPRTLEVADVIAASAPGSFHLTVDGNEQFADLGVLLRFIKSVDEQPNGRALLDRLICIEQPLPRASSFDPAAKKGLAALAEIAPVILDEADHGIEALPAALALGYGGVSVKNCKGVQRALLQRGLCELHGAFQSAEDLTNLGVLALQQDLATVAALGLKHVERNGHHYFRGLGHLSDAEAKDAARAHPELWKPTSTELEGGHSGDVQLCITDGKLDLGSLQGVGYGYASEIDWAARTPLEDWTFQEPTR